MNGTTIDRRLAAARLQAAVAAARLPRRRAARARSPLLRRGRRRAAAEPVGRRRCAASLDHLDDHPADELPADYVETFDLRRRCCLYLTYYAHGDTRKRGHGAAALQAGLPRPPGSTLADDELPDHLARRAASSPRTATAPGRGCCRRTGPGIELLRAGAARRRLAVRRRLRRGLAPPCPAAPADERDGRRRSPAGPARGGGRPRAVRAARVHAPAGGPSMEPDRGGRCGSCGSSCRTSPSRSSSVGHIWRYRYDKFGWTTRSSQLYENRLLRLGSPLFHFGILFVVLGHVGGLLIPEAGPRRSASPRRRTTRRGHARHRRRRHAPSPGWRS